MSIRRTAAAVVLSAATVVSGMALGAGTASAAESLPVSGADYRISSYAGGALQWDGNGNGSNVVVRDWNGSSAQQVWTVRDEGNGTWTLKVPGTNNAVDRDRARNTVGAWNYVGADNQRWWLENTTMGNGRAWLLHSVSDGNLCLARGADLNTKVAACNAGDPAQSWNLDRNGGGTGPGPGPGPVTSDQQRFLDRLNALRAQYGKAPVRFNDTLSQAAKCNADQMDQRRVSGHFCDSPSIAAGLGYTGRGSGEIAFYGPTNIDAAVDGWINSPLHLGIMIGDYNEVGLARTGAASWNADFSTR
jgi:uncharacterized protein YkwD